MAGEIVVGYDGGEGAEAALSEAIALAKDLGARLILGFGFFPNLPEREARDYVDAVREFGEKATSQAVERAKGEGVEAEAVLVAKRPAEGLAELADARDARMVVVGSHGERPIAGALLGSTPHKLLHITHKPVLVARVPDS
jgi:nucleotide-binding universal stress UspA family protein